MSVLIRLNKDEHIAKLEKKKLLNKTEYFKILIILKLNENKKLDFSRI